MLIIETHAFAYIPVQHWSNLLIQLGSATYVEEHAKDYGQSPCHLIDTQIIQRQGEILLVLVDATYCWTGKDVVGDHHQRCIISICLIRLLFLGCQDFEDFLSFLSSGLDKSVFTLEVPTKLILTWKSRELLMNLLRLNTRYLILQIVNPYRPWVVFIDLAYEIQSIVNTTSFKEEMKT